MEKNMGTTDQWVRRILALVLIALFGFEVVKGTIGIVLVALALILLVTSFISFCPLYTIFGIRTGKPGK